MFKRRQQLKARNYDGQPPESGWTDINGETDQSIHLSLEGPALPCDKIVVVFEKNFKESDKMQGPKTKRLKNEEDSFREKEDLKTAFHHYTGEFKKEDGKVQYGRPVFKNKKGKYLALIEVKPKPGCKVYTWTVCDWDPNNLIQERFKPENQWFTQGSRSKYLSCTAIGR